MRATGLEGTSQLQHPESISKKYIYSEITMIIAFYNWSCQRWNQFQKIKLVYVFDHLTVLITYYRSIYTGYQHRLSVLPSDSTRSQKIFKILEIRFHQSIHMVPLLDEFVGWPGSKLGQRSNYMQCIHSFTRTILFCNISGQKIHPFKRQSYWNFGFKKTRMVAAFKFNLFKLVFWANGKFLLFCLTSLVHA